MMSCLVSKVTSLFGCIHIRSENPFLLCIYNLDCPKYYLIRLHFESGSQLLQRHCFMIILFVNVMSEADEVLIILERNHSLAVHFGQRENVFQDVRNAVAQSSVEIVENQMRIGLAHWIHLVLQVVSEDHIG